MNKHIETTLIEKGAGVIIASEFYCDCSKARPTRCVQKNGVEVVALQCPVCGRRIRNLRKADYDIESLPGFEETLRTEWQQAMSDRYKELGVLRETLYKNKKTEDRDMWFEAYNRYLETRQWYTVRQRVLERDNNLCQACLDKKATQVHHVSYKYYDQLGYSFAHELIAICERCHRLIHPHMADAQESHKFFTPYLNGT